MDGAEAGEGGTRILWRMYGVMVSNLYRLLKVPSSAFAVNSPVHAREKRPKSQGFVYGIVALTCRKTLYPSF
jgi:hypothetical protein